MIKLTITSNAAQTLEEFRKARAEANAKLIEEVWKGAIQIQSIAKQRYFIQGAGKGAFSNPDKLTSRTGRLRSSITAIRPVMTAGTGGSIQSVESLVGTNKKYAAIHELGGQTSAHDIYPKNKLALRWFNYEYSATTGKDRWMFAKVVHHPGSKIPKRSFLQRARDDEATDILNRINAALAKALRGS